MKIKDIENLLREIIASKSDQKKSELISRFQNHFFLEEYDFGNELFDEILVNLAYDLEYYEPNPLLRKEDPSFYGDEKLEKKLNDVLEKIQIV